MAKLMLKPQVSAFLEIVSRHGGAGSPLRGDRRHREVASGREDDPRHSASATTPARSIIRRRGRRDLRHDADPGRTRYVGRRADLGRHGGGARASSRSCSRRGRPLPARSDRRARRRAPGRGAEVELERPGDPEHGDYATNVALRLAPVAAARPAGARARSSPPPPPSCPTSSGPRSRGRASSTSSSPTPGSRGAGRGARAGLRRRVPGAARARPGRDGLREPDRADRRLRGAERRHRRLARAPARARRRRGRARVLLQRRGRADGRVPRVGRGDPAWGGAARGRLPAASTSASWRSFPATRCRRCWSRSRRRSSASASTSTRGRSRAGWRSGCRSCSRGSTRTSATARSGRAPPRTATTRTG